jgi:hypothetical protein
MEQFFSSNVHKLALEKFEHNDLLQMIMLETRLLMCKMDHQKITSLLVE